MKKVLIIVAIIFVANIPLAVFAGGTDGFLVPWSREVEEIQVESRIGWNLYISCNSKAPFGYGAQSERLPIFPSGSIIEFKFDMPIEQKQIGELKYSLGFPTSECCLKPVEKSNCGYRIILNPQDYCLGINTVYFFQKIMHGKTVKYRIIIPIWHRHINKTETSLLQFGIEYCEIPECERTDINMGMWLARVNADASRPVHSSEVITALEEKKAEKIIAPAQTKASFLIRVLSNCPSKFMWEDNGKVMEKEFSQNGRIPVEVVNQAVFKYRVIGAKDTGWREAVAIDGQEITEDVR